MIVLLDSIAKKTSCFHYFSHGASLHHCSFSTMIFTLVLYSISASYGILRRIHVCACANGFGVVLVLEVKVILLETLEFEVHYILAGLSDGKNRV